MSWQKIIDEGLKQTVDRFLVAVDALDAATIMELYDPDFMLLRVGTDGSMAGFTRLQMIEVLKSRINSVGHAIPTLETTIHHIEVIGDMGFTLLTRVKDLGEGWEPMQYNIIWRKNGGTWRLLREFVYQKSLDRKVYKT